MLYRFFRILGLIYIKIFFPYRIIGKENLNIKGPVIMVCNHISLLDPIVTGVIIKRTIYYIAKVELFKNRFIRWLLLKFHAIPVNRHANDVHAIKHSLKALSDGHVFGIFPEGTRSKSGEIRPFERGLGYIAVKSGAPILPIRFKKLFKLFHRQVIVVGKPFHLEGFDPDAITVESINRATERCEEALKAL